MILNPVVVFEVLSKSTMDYDRGTKFVAYRRITSLREYVLVDQYSHGVEHYRKEDGGQWRLEDLTDIEEVLHLPSLDVKLPLKRIYHRLDGIVNGKVRPVIHRNRGGCACRRCCRRYAGACSKKQCQRARKAKWQREKMASDEDYRKKQADSQARWAANRRDRRRLQEGGPEDDGADRPGEKRRMAQHIQTGRAALEPVDEGQDTFEETEPRRRRWKKTSRRK